MCVCFDRNFGCRFGVCVWGVCARTISNRSLLSHKTQGLYHAQAALLSSLGAQDSGLEEDRELLLQVRWCRLLC